MPVTTHPFDKHLVAKLVSRLFCHVSTYHTRQVQYCQNTNGNVQNKDSPEYWKFRLAIKLIQDIYMFPSDESCKREFYDTVSNDKMRVMGREFIPGERSVVANVDFTIGSHIMDVSTVAVLLMIMGIPHRSTLQDIRKSSNLCSSPPELIRRSTGLFC